MRYRYPTSILWNNDGYRETEATHFDAAVESFKSKWPGMRIDYQCVQVNSCGEWKFAETVPEILGGYDRGRYVA